MVPPPAQPAESDAAAWTDATALDTLRARGSMTLKLGARQIALFWHQGRPLACNNRCPHEGYPLCEGHLASDGVLTCQWHNWKFDLASGANLYGGDGLRVYAARVAGGRVELDLREPPREQRVAAALSQLAEAMADEDRPRIARELARLHREGESSASALTHAIVRDHARFRYGMTHAHAGADAWLRLAESWPGDDEAAAAARLACGAEALGHLARDALREPERGFDEGCDPWDAASFLAAIEAQDESAAVRRLHGALDAGLAPADLRGTLASAALAHYQDFGHSAIYLVHLLNLAQRLGPAVHAPLLRTWTRSLVHATREDLLPDFRAYADALRQWPAAAAAAPGPAPRASDFAGRSIAQTLAAARAAAAHDPEASWLALLHAGALHLLRFDAHWAERTDTGVADQVGWLDFSHALTFGHAVRGLCRREPGLWPAALLQMALFVGRNTPYLAAGLDSSAAVARWQVDDVEAFHQRCRARIVDHGLGLDIVPVHWLKTWLAVHEMSAGAMPADTAAALLAALNRLFDARFKQRHALRHARQALAFVAREG